jgi:endonuclease YncB( thermonuclease family)
LATATLILAILFASQSRAASAVVRDGGAVALADVTYRLDRIDAPAFDQMCIDEHADPWACGVEAAISWPN